MNKVSIHIALLVFVIISVSCEFQEGAKGFSESGSLTDRGQFSTVFFDDEEYLMLEFGDKKRQFTALVSTQFLKAEQESIEFSREEIRIGEKVFQFGRENFLLIDVKGAASSTKIPRERFVVRSSATE